MAAKAKLSVLGLYQWNHRIFSDMKLPEEVDADTLTWKILEDCAELEIIYADPDYMKESLQHWSSAMLPNWQKMAEALTAKYNPIWNKDGTVSETHKFGARHSTGINEVTAFNTDTYHPNERSSADQDAASDVYTRIEQGNIGVTESSAMVRHEIELRSDYNIYSIIANDFKNHYCLMVY